MLKLYLLYLLSIYLSPNLYYFMTGDNSLFIGLSEMLMPVLVGVNAVYMMFTRTDRYPVDAEAGFIVKAMFVLMLWGTAMVFLTPYIFNSTITFLIKYILNIILLFQFSRIIPNLMKGPEQESLLLKYIFIAFVGVAFVSMLEIVYPDLVHFIYIFERESSISVWLGKYRLTGTAGGPNTYVVIIYTLTAMLLAQYHRYERPLYRVLTIVTIAYFIQIAILTASRGGLLAIATQLLVFVYISFSKPRNMNVKIVIVCLLAIVFVFVIKIMFLLQEVLVESFFEIGKTYSIYYIKFMSETAYPDFFKKFPPALIERIYIAQQGLDAFLNFSWGRKITGTGLNASNFMLRKFSNINLTSFHNAFVQYLFCTGLPGFVLYMTIIRRTYVYLKKKSESFLAMSTFLMFIGFLVHSLFEANFLWNFKSMQIYILFISLTFAENARDNAASRAGHTG